MLVTNEAFLPYLDRIILNIAIIQMNVIQITTKMSNLADKQTTPLKT